MSYNEKAKRVMLRKSEEKYESALDDFSKGRYDSCVSNLYYSAFQSTTAYMIQQGALANKHRQVRSFVNKELANTGLITRESAKLYNRLMDQRSDADLVRYMGPYSMARKFRTVICLDRLKA